MNCEICETEKERERKTLASLGCYIKRGFHLFPSWKNCVYSPVRKKRKHKRQRALVMHMYRYMYVCSIYICACAPQEMAKKKKIYIDSKNKQEKVFVCASDKRQQFLPKYFHRLPKLSPSPLPSSLLLPCHPAHAICHSELAKARKKFD